MRLYHFTNGKHGLAAVRDQRLKIARLHELNDPFEFLGVDLSDPQLRRLLSETKAELSKTKGLVCFSRSWRHPLLWAHYADKHRGLCLGFEVHSEGFAQVSYVNSRLLRPATIDEVFIQRLLFTKFAHWSYEDEYRAYVSLTEAENGLYFLPTLHQLELKEVIVGCDSEVTRAQLDAALTDRSSDVRHFKARPAFRSFRMVRQKNESLWA